MPAQFLQYPRRNRFAVGPISRGIGYVRNASARATQPELPILPNRDPTTSVVSLAPLSGSAAQPATPILPNNSAPFCELFLALGSVTISIGSPAVITFTAHGLANGREVYLQTTGALPTGFVVNTRYFVVNAAANTFQLAPSVGGSAISTSGTQSGTHTLYYKSP